MMISCDSLQILAKGEQILNSKLLSEANSYLRDPELRRRILKSTVESSFAIEGVNVNLGIINFNGRSLEIVDEGFRGLCTNVEQPSFRCALCNKLLAKPNTKGEIAGQIKCPRCGEFNER